MKLNPGSRARTGKRGKFHRASPGKGGRALQPEERAEILGAQPDVAQKHQCALANDNSEASAECRLLPENMVFSYPPLIFYISQLASGFGGPFLIKNGK